MAQLRRGDLATSLTSNLRAMRPKTRLFFILLIAGVLGVVSFLLVDLPALLEILPIPPDTELPPVHFIKALSLVQPSILVLLAAFAGVMLAGKVNLHAPAAEAMASREPIWPALRRQIVPGIVGGVLGGVGIVAASALWKPYLPTEVVDLIARFGTFLPLPTRLLYGGITEEVLLRWGLMTLLVWGGWRLFQRGKGAPKSAWFVAAILVSSVIFGIGHLPIAFMLFEQPTVALMAFIVVANSLFGLIAGALYWKWGLESAIVAHMVTHLALYAASLAGAYF